MAEAAKPEELSAKAEREDNVWADMYEPDEEMKKWAAILTKDWRETIASIIKTGLDLIQAKKELGYGRFCDLWFEEEPLLPFSQRTANKLMRIARNKVLTHSTHESNLPNSWPTLYVLACMPENKLYRLILQGKVHPDMMRKDAERLISNIPSRLISGIKTLVGIMNDNDYESMDALVADVREIIDDKDDKECWGVKGKKKSGAFRRLADLAAFIVKIDEVWQHHEDDIDESAPNDETNQAEIDEEWEQAAPKASKAKKKRGTQTPSPQSAGDARR